MIRTLCASMALILIGGYLPVRGQVAPWHHKTLLPDSLVNRFIDEVSGEIAMQHVYTMASFNRNRLAKEYQQNYLEADYVLGKLEEYGFDAAEIEYFDADSVWDGEAGELWEVSPRTRKIADYDSEPAVLAKGSLPADTLAELVYVGRGSSSIDYDSVDVAGKIVLGYGGTGSLHRQAVVKRGAAGVVSFSSIHPLEDPDQIPWFGVSGAKGKCTFGFNLGLRRGMALRDRLERGEKIVVRARVKSSYQPQRHNVVVASIQGRDLPGESVLYTAHLFEGIAKQGANDDISGSAAILEVGRSIIQLMREGVIPRPRRTLRFLWVPEFSGTIPWVKAHPDLLENTLVNINLDMVGGHLAKNRGSYNLQRTPFSRPSYLNDVLESLMDYVSETNREVLYNRPTTFTNPIIAPTGSRDPFFYKIDYHYGASDHVVMNDWGVGVPGVMPITWPDMWYHSSGDRPDKMDPTQMKRAAFINAVAGYVIADAGKETALRLAGEVYSNGLGRLGREYQRAAEMLTYAAPLELAVTYKRARNVVRQAIDQERRTMLSILELIGEQDKVAGHVKASARELERKIGPRLIERLKAHYRPVCGMHGVKAEEPSLTSAERQAKKLVPRPTEKVAGYFKSAWINDAVEKSVRDSLTTISRRTIRELRRLINGKRSALDIANVLDAEFEKPTDVADVVNYLRLLERAGLVRM